MPTDPRVIEDERIGARLRDGAVDPRPADFLGPSNAGTEGEQGNPHGPTVVSPEVHAHQGARPVRPGEVDDDPGTQSTGESDHMGEWQPQTEPQTEPEPEPEPGPEESEEG